MKISLKWKTIILVVSVIAVISVVMIAAIAIGGNSIIRSQYSERSLEISGIAAVSVDAEQVRAVRDAVLEIYESAENKVTSEEWGTPEFEAYVSLYAGIEQMPEYIAVREDLRRIQDVSDVDCFYIVYLDMENVRYVYLVDAAYEDACPPGCIDPFYAGEEIMDRTDPYRNFLPNITNTAEYGWLLATGRPIRTEDGEFVGYACVDYSMNDIMAKQGFYVRLVGLIMVFIAVLSGAACILLVDRFAVKPLNTLSSAAANYVTGDSGVTQYKFAELDIHSGDELETLSDSMKQMERDMNEHITNLLAATKELKVTKQYAAHMGNIANRDALTGVRNKRAFDAECQRLDGLIEKGEARFAIAMIDLNYLKLINDNYGHDKGNTALQTLCRIVCNIFKRSPVFRIGGDEFTVTLENRDLEDADRLLKQLDDVVRGRASDPSLEPWEQSSAAVGCAVYEPGQDKSAEDVLKRADELMYRRKKEMKALRGDEAPWETT